MGKVIIKGMVKMSTLPNKYSIGGNLQCDHKGLSKEPGISDQTCLRLEISSLKANAPFLNPL